MALFTVKSIICYQTIADSHTPASGRNELNMNYEKEIVNGALLGFNFVYLCLNYFKLDGLYCSDHLHSNLNQIAR